MDAKLLWMCIYQFKYGGDAGKDYLDLSKKDFHRKYRL